MLVGAASSAGARVRPTPQESVAAPKFSTKKLVVARPRLKVVFRFPAPAFPENDFPLISARDSNGLLRFSGRRRECISGPRRMNRL